ncbi:MAG: hypothetical protein INR73_06670 [Williamsia sp.]|nr:hypothetical protein [Williamsia sp.]
MKHTIGWICMLFPVFAFAQSKATVDSTARSVLNELIGSWTLGVDSSNETDIKVYNRFKSFFAPGATIDDDFNVFFLYDAQKRSGAYQVQKEAGPKSFDVYAHDVALQVRSLVIDSVSVIDSNMADRRNIQYRLGRRVVVQKTRQYVLTDDYVNEVLGGRTIGFEGKNDSLKMVSNLKEKAAQNPQAIYAFQSFNTVLVTMSFGPDSAVLITSIKSLANEVVCINDADKDAVLDQDDSLKNKPGDFTANGKPDSDLDGVADGSDKCKVTYGDARNHGCPAAYFLTKNSFEGFFGLQSGPVNIALPGPEGLGYLYGGANAVDANPVLFNKGTLRNPGNRLAVYGGGSFTHYFGQKRKRIGISIGLTYSAVSADYWLEDSIVYTYRTSDGIQDYRRQITIKGGGTVDGKWKKIEEIKYGIFNLPVMFNFRSNLDKNHKLVLNLRAGPSLMVFRNTSYYNAIIDFGGLYQLNGYSLVYDSSSPYNIYFTSAYIRDRNRLAGNNSPNAPNDIFNKLDSIKYLAPGGLSYLDFASDKPFNGNQDMTRFAVAANLNIDFHYKVSEGLTIKLGPHIVYASYLPAKTKYKPIDRTTDEYQSIYKGNAKSNYSAYGVSLGFVYDF